MNANGFHFSIDFLAFVSTWFGAVKFLNFPEAGTFFAEKALQVQTFTK